MKLTVTLSLLLLLSSCTSAQNKKEATDYLMKNHARLNLEYFIFYEAELIECATDSLFRESFKWKVQKQIQRIEKFSVQGANERRVFLNVLYNRINSLPVSDKALVESKSFLISQLSRYIKLNFEVNFKLVEERFDPRKRGLPFGDEECDVDNSKLIFFVYNPELYLKVITESKIANPSGKIVFPKKCFLEELNYFPLDLKKRTQNEMLKMIEKYEGSNFEALRKVIQNADLSARYN